MVKVLVCGGRDYSDDKHMSDVLNAFNLGGKIETIIHGGARGADSLAGEWAKSKDIPVEVYPAQWDKYGKSAGYKRNAQMLEEGKPDFVIAFPGGKGTDMMVELAKKAKVFVMDLRIDVDTNQ